MSRLIIKAKSEKYRADEIKQTMTVSELRDLLSQIEQQNPSAKVYLKFYEGYSFGGLRKEDFILEEEINNGK